MTKLEAYYITGELESIEQLAIIAASLDVNDPQKASESFSKLAEMAGDLSHVIMENLD